jgi:hypothetical protein
MRGRAVEWLAGSVWLGLSLTSAVAAAEAGNDSRADNPRFVRGEAHFASDVLGGSNFGSLGIAAGWDVTPFFGVEGYLGRGFEDEEQYSPGSTAMVNLRLLPAISADGVHAFTLAGGALRFWDGGWGELTFAHLEAGYEARLRLGLTLAASAGFDVAFNDSREPDRKRGCSGVCFDSPQEVRSGDVYPHVRLSAGWSF